MNNKFNNKLNRIRERDGNSCWLCKMPIIFAQQNELYEYRHVLSTMDHIKPKAHGGNRQDHNLRIAHAWCNSRRGTKPYDKDVFGGLNGKKYIMRILAPLLEAGLITPEQAVEKAPRIVELYPHLFNKERHSEPQARWRDEWSS